MYHRLSVWLADTYLQGNDMEEEKRSCVLYYIENMLAGAGKILLVLITAALFGIFTETAAMLLSYTVVRQKAFGWHARKSLHCTLVSLLCFVLVPLLLQEVEWNRFLLVGIGLLSLTLSARYAPADTEYNPLVDRKFRRARKIQAVLLNAVFLLISVVLGFNQWFIFGLFLEAIVITPLFYSIMRRSYANYEQYQEC